MPGMTTPIVDASASNTSSALTTNTLTLTHALVSVNQLPASPDTNKMSPHASVNPNAPRLTVQTTRYGTQHIASVSVPISPAAPSAIHGITTHAHAKKTIDRCAPVNHH